MAAKRERLAYVVSILEALEEYDQAPVAHKWDTRELVSWLSTPFTASVLEHKLDRHGIDSKILIDLIN